MGQISRLVAASLPLLFTLLLWKLSFELSRADVVVGVLLCVLLLDMEFLQRVHETAQRVKLMQQPLLPQMSVTRMLQKGEFVSRAESETMYEFLAQCKKINYGLLKSLTLVEVGDGKILEKQLMDADFRQARNELLRVLSKRLTHPIFGISPTVAGDDSYRATEIVDWLCNNFTLSKRSDAVDIGRALHLAGILKPCKRGKTERFSGPRKRVQFGDKMRKWKFSYDDIEDGWANERNNISIRAKSVAGVTQQHNSVSAPVVAGTAIGGQSGIPQPIQTGPGVTSASANATGASASSPTSAVPLLAEDVAGGMGAREWKYLLAASRTETFDMGTEILTAEKPNDFLYRIQKGQVKITGSSSASKNPSSIIVGEDGVFGEMSACQVMGNNSSDVTVVAITSVSVQYIDSRSLAKLLKIDNVVAKVFWRWLAVSMASRFNRLLRSEHILQLGQKSKGPVLQLRREDVEPASRRLSTLFPEWTDATVNALDRAGSKLIRNRNKLSEDDKVNEGSIKNFPVRWMNSKGTVGTKAQLYVTQKGVGVVSVLRMSMLRQAIAYNMIENVEILSSVSRATNVMMIAFTQYKRKHREGSESARGSGVLKKKHRELLVQFENKEQLQQAFELTQHMRDTSNSNNNNNNNNDSSFSLTDGSADGSVPGSVFGEFELQADDWAHLTESSAVKMFRKGQPIVIAGTPASVLLHITQGSVLMVSHGTTDVVLGVVGEGDIIGDTEFVLGTAHALSYVAESDCECLELDASVFLKALFVQHPQVAARFFRFLCTAISFRTSQVASVLAKDTTK